MHIDATIKHIIEHILGHRIKLDNSSDVPWIDTQSIDEIALIKRYINNPSLVTKQLKEQLVAKQLDFFTDQEVSTPPATTWQEYIAQLEKAVAQVKHRRAHNYDLCEIMPTFGELMQWQQACLDLTEQWYGSGNGNISCFYNYFILMSQLAGVTRFNYYDIEKYISADHFISIVNPLHRREAFHQHEQNMRQYLAQGGHVPIGKSVIDATMLSNVMHYRHAQLCILHTYAKRIITKELGLENFGQLAYQKRALLWQMLQQHYPAMPTESNSIFFKFAEFVAARPGEYFNYFDAALPEANHIAQDVFHDIVKIAGLQTNHLVLIPRATTYNWLVKKYVTLQWERKYPLQLVKTKDDLITIRPADSIETARILPNELPYAPGHGLSLCGNGAPEFAQGESLDYEWNDPIESVCNIDNWPRDIEKIFREFKFFTPVVHEKEMLFGEVLCNIFHNNMAYSTIHTTQHTHILVSTVEEYKIYCLPAFKSYNFKKLQVLVELVRIGHEPDAIYLRFLFDDLHNESLLKFLIDFNNAVFKHFNGVKNIDVFMQLFANRSRKLVFIYQPHALLQQLEHDTFLNPHTDVISLRKPQFREPHGKNIVMFSNEMAAGLEYCRELFDATLCPTVLEFIEEFLDQYLESQQ